MADWIDYAKKGYSFVNPIYRTYLQSEEARKEGEEKKKKRILDLPDPAQPDIGPVAPEVDEAQRLGEEWAKAPSKTWLGSSSREVRESQVRPEDVGALRRQHEKESEAQFQDLERRGRHLRGQKGELERQVGLQADERFKASEGAYNLQLEHDRLSKRTDQLRERLSGLRVDPNRFLNEMPTVAKVLMALGAGFSGSAKDVMQYVAAGAERDIQAQRANIHKQIQEYNLTADQQRNVWKQWARMEDVKRQAAKDIYEITRDHAKLQEQLAGLPGQIDKLGAQQFREAMKMEIESRPQVTTRKGGHQVINPKHQAGLQLLAKRAMATGSAADKTYARQEQAKSEFFNGYFGGFVPMLLKAKKDSSTGRFIYDIEGWVLDKTKMSAVYKAHNRWTMEMVRQLSGVQNREKEQQRIQQATIEPDDNEKRALKKIEIQTAAYARSQLVAARERAQMGDHVSSRLHLMRLQDANRIRRQLGFGKITRNSLTKALGY